MLHKVNIRKKAAYCRKLLINTLWRFDHARFAKFAQTAHSHIYAYSHNTYSMYTYIRTIYAYSYAL